MSAATAETRSPMESNMPEPVQLSVVERPDRGFSALGFGLILVFIVVVGLATVMVITTTAAQQSREIARLTTQSTELGYHRAALTTQLQQRESVNSLASRASRLGMVPSPYPVFISLKDATVIGEPTPVVGDEMPFLLGKTPDAPLPGAVPGSTPEG